MKGGHFQLACGTFFELTHGIENGFSPNHPNQYFDESRGLETGGKEKAEAGMDKAVTEIKIMALVWLIVYLFQIMSVTCNLPPPLL